MKEKIIELIWNRGISVSAGEGIMFDERIVEELADEILALHNKELERFANQLGISTAPVGYFTKSLSVREEEQ